MFGIGAGKGRRRRTAERGGAIKILASAA